MSGHYLTDEPPPLRRFVLKEEYRELTGDACNLVKLQCDLTKLGYHLDGYSDFSPKESGGHSAGVRGRRDKNDDPRSASEACSL